MIIILLAGTMPAPQYHVAGSSRGRTFGGVLGWGAGRRSWRSLTKAAIPRAVIADFNRKMDMATDSNEQLRTNYGRQQLRHYVAYSLESAAQQAIALLEGE